MTVKQLIEELSIKFKSIEEKDNKIIIRTFYKNGNQKNWYSINEVENGDYRLTKGGSQLRDGNGEFILDCCLKYIN
jgi:hypothetical protein